MPTDSTETLYQRYQREAQIDAQIQLWEGWRDVRVHGLPNKGQPVIFAVGDNFVAAGHFAGGAFIYAQQPFIPDTVRLWRPMPDSLPPDVHARLLEAELAKCPPTS